MTVPFFKQDWDFSISSPSASVQLLEKPQIQEFIEGHSSALNSSFTQVEMSDIMRRRLERSNYIFSGFKAFHELNEAFPSLIDENGNRKSFERFLNDVRKIDETYNSNYLRAEYNFVQASATMAGKWEEFSRYGDRYNLQYRTVGDDKVRPEHAALNRVTLPITDKFWEEFYPPNGWGCRCTVVQVRKSKYPATDHDEAMSLGELATGKDTKGIFRFNSGKQEKAVPDYNPYTISRCRDCDIANGKLKLAFAPDNELCAACRIIREQQKLKAARDTYRRLLADPDYTDVRLDEKTGGVMATHVGHMHHDAEKENTYFDGLTGEDLERLCQEQLFRLGHTAILRDESQRIGADYLPALDLELDGRIMDIRTICVGTYYGNALMRKNQHLGNVRRKTGLHADSLCLYFHDAALFSEEKLSRDIEWYKNRVVEVESKQRIKHLYVVVRGASELKVYDI